MAQTCLVGEQEVLACPACGEHFYRGAVRWVGRRAIGRRYGGKTVACRAGSRKLRGAKPKSGVASGDDVHIVSIRNE